MCRYQPIHGVMGAINPKLSNRIVLLLLLVASVRYLYVLAIATQSG